MKYISTRGNALVLEFSDVLLAGLANDGGLYLPETWPEVEREDLRRFRDMEYADVAAEIVALFVGKDIPKTDLRRMCQRAYGNFRHATIAPVAQLTGTDWVLELHHGPTLAFKDIAMQLLGQLFDYVLTKRQSRLTIIGATSGDTGGAAIEALKDCAAVDVFILHPENRVSDVQRKMMTTVVSPNVHNIAIKGSFDDCQTLVKDMFGDKNFSEKVQIGAINSINWARILAQSVYYITSAVALGAPNRAMSFVVPTGNFGDIFAGYVADKLGLPVQALGVATNENDILDRALRSGEHKLQGVVPTTSPSMDIQISSNFERLLFEESGRDAELIRTLMASLKQSGEFIIPKKILKNIGSKFVSARASEDETKAKMKEIFDNYAMLIDPHTAVGLVAKDKMRRASAIADTVVTLSTAHPAKFPDAVMAATGQHPELPSAYASLFDREEYFTSIDNDIDKVKQFILSKARLAQ